MIACQSPQDCFTDKNWAFLSSIVTVDEKCGWRMKYRSQTRTRKSKVKYCVYCGIVWDIIYHELMKSNLTIAAVWYAQQLQRLKEKSHSLAPRDYHLFCAWQNRLNGKTIYNWRTSQWGCPKLRPVQANHHLQGRNWQTENRWEKVI